MFNLYITSSNRNILEAIVDKQIKTIWIDGKEVRLRNPAEIYLVIGEEDSVRIRYRENAIVSLIKDAVQISGLENIKVIPKISEREEFYTLNLIFPRKTKLVLETKN